MARFIIVTGLPASGKTTVGTALASELGRPLIDKDVILEAMFDSVGMGDSAWRTRLSRAADAAMRRMARASGGAVLVSWWRHPASSMDSGTATEWLSSLPGELVELHCRCAPDVAVDRFFARRRHPGHLDGQRTRAHDLQTFTTYASLGAIGMGRVVDIRTEGAVDVRALVDELNP